MSPRVHDGTGGDVAACIAAVQAVLDDLLAARRPAPIPETGCAPEVLPLVRSTNRVIAQVAETADFVLPLARGDLGAPLPAPGNAMAAAFVTMHESLRRLTEQANLVAAGDYSQRIGFIGDFSRAFNTMVEQLAEREAALKAEIAHRRRAEEQLQLERDLLVAGPLVTIRWDLDDQGTVQYISPNISAFGYESEEFVTGGRTYDSIVHPDDLAGIVADGNANAARGLDAWIQEYRLIDRSGGDRWVRDYTHAIRDPDGTVTSYEGYVIDVTTQRQAEEALRRREEQLRMLSLYDELTGLYNRRGFFAVGEYALRAAGGRGAAAALAALDIDGLRVINHRFGNARGDDALRDVAAVLRAVTAEHDVVARTGGDEFAVLVERDAAGAAELTRRLRRRLDGLRRAEGRPFRLSVRLGLALWQPEGPPDPAALLERATRELRLDGRESTHTG